MATSRNCSMCIKEAGPIHCTGCDEYFCWKDFKSHRDGMFIEMDKIVEERNRLQDIINNAVPHNDQQSPIIAQIEKWKNETIEKIKQVAAQARQQAIQLLNNTQTKINNEFKSFSQELVKLKESENYVEHDLKRLNQMISQFKESLKQPTEQTTIEVHTEQSNGINWDRLIYVEEKQTYKDPQIPSPPPPPQLTCGGRACTRCGKCSDWYWDEEGGLQRRDDSTCRDASNLRYYAADHLALHAHLLLHADHLALHAHLLHALLLHAAAARLAAARAHYLHLYLHDLLNDLDHFCECK